MTDSEALKKKITNAKPTSWLTDGLTKEEIEQALREGEIRSRKMGMTIDEHIGVIEDLESAIKIWMPDPEKTEINQSLHVAIDTMRKYQKIQEIIANNENDGIIGRLIREVIEDGKIN